MGQNLKLDPKKRDYVVVNGSPVSTDRVFEKAYFAIKIPENKWVYGVPGQGSLVYTLNNVKRTAEIEQRFANFTNKAIQNQLIDTGEAIQKEVTNTDQTSTTSENTIAIEAPVSVTTQFNFTGV